MKVRLYDGWNYIRMSTETDITSLTPRRLYQDMVDAPEVLHIWVWDGRGARKMRQEIFPAYKTKRKPAANDIYATMQLFRDLLQHSPGYSIELEGFEADDIIAALVEHYAVDANNTVEIYSNDFDLMALTAGRTNVFCGAKPKKGVDPKDVQIYKAFFGDPSDDVPGVKGFGQAAWDASDKRILHNIAACAVSGKDEALEGLLSKMFRDEVRNERSIKAWIKANLDQLAAMVAVVGFIPVSLAIITDNVKRPIPNPEKVDEILKQYML